MSARCHKKLVSEPELFSHLRSLSLIPLPVSLPQIGTSYSVVAGWPDKNAVWGIREAESLGLGAP